MYSKELSKILIITFLLLATIIPLQTPQVESAPAWYQLSGYNYYSSEYWSNPELALNGTGYGLTDLDGELVISLLKPYNITKISSRSNLDKDPTNVTVYYKTKLASTWSYLCDMDNFANSSSFVDTSFSETMVKYLKFIVEKGEDSYLVFWGNNYPILRVYGEAVTSGLYGETSSVTTSSTTLSCYGYDITGTVGFHYGTTPAYGNNVTVSGTYNEWYGGFSKGITTNHSTYYYYRAWHKNSTGFHTFPQHYFLTKPYTPYSISSTSTGWDFINISWSNTTTFVDNQTTIVKYSDSTYPLTYIGAQYNGTLEYFNATSLLSGTTYYFSLWTYINASGSPLLHSHSSRDIFSATTISGLHNFSLRWENVTYNYIDLGLDTPEDYTTQHNFIVHYGLGTGAVEYNEFEEGVGWRLTQSNDFTDTDATDGNWSINVTTTPVWVEFEWLNSDERWGWNLFTQDYSCHRTLVIEPGKRNYTFFVRTDLHPTPAILTSVSNWLNQTSLVQYTYHFIDNNGEYGLENNPYAIIYTYDQEGNKLTIHSEYFDKNNEIHPYLVTGKTYYLGIKSSTNSMPYIGKAPTGSDASVDIEIPKSLIYNESIYDYIKLNIGWYDTGMYIEYNDTTFTMIEANLSIFSENSTQQFNNNSTLDIHNFTWSEAQGCNLSTKYILILNFTMEEIGLVTTGYLPIYPNINYSITSNSSIDTVLTMLLGETPMKTSSGIGVSYAYICILILTMLGLLSFKKEQAHIGLFVEGCIFILSAGAITGLRTLFVNYSWTHGIVLGSIGFFLIILGLWASLAGKHKEVNKE